MYTNYKIDFQLRNENNDTACDIATRKGDISMQKWVEDQDSSSKFASQLLDELSDDEVPGKKSKKKNKKSKKKVVKSLTCEEQGI